MIQAHEAAEVGAKKGAGELGKAVAGEIKAVDDDNGTLGEVANYFLFYLMLSIILKRMKEEKEKK